jgi:hypothetical protein
MAMRTDKGKNRCQAKWQPDRSLKQQRFYYLGPASRTAIKTFSTEGLKNRPFLATVLPSTWTVNSPRFPFTSSTSTPGSFRKASATRAACCLVPPQTGHSRMVTFFIAEPPSILER